MKVYIGVDCGATNLRVGVLDREGKLLASSKTSSPLRRYPNQFARIVKKEVSKLAMLASQGQALRAPVPYGTGRAWEVAGIGVGTPGPIDQDKGLLLPSANIGNQKPIDLKTQFEVEFDINIYFDRDTNVALLGEAWKGEAVGNQDVVMLTLGSGVGGAVMVNGQLERGMGGKAGEIGHMIIQIRNSRQRRGSPLAAKFETIQNLPVCGLGHEGCLEALINSTKDPMEMATYLGLGLANIVDILAPEKIILGGGKVVKGLSVEEQRGFVAKAVEIMRKFGTEGAVERTEVVYAKLGDLSGLYGGAKLVIDQDLGFVKT